MHHPLLKALFSLWLLTGVACSPANHTPSNVGDSALADVAVPNNQADYLYVAAEYDEHDIRIHYRLEVENPSWYHQYWVYRAGEWHLKGSGIPGQDPHGLYEDRISMLLDDGSVQGFDRFGGFMLVHPGMRSLDSAVSPQEVAAHPLLGSDIQDQLDKHQVRKYLPQSRNGEYYSDPARWHDTKTREQLAAMQRDGVFLDLWQWRAHRSNPVGYADNGYVLHSRLDSSGRAMSTLNQHAASQRPAYMFDVEQVGHHALRWEQLTQRAYDQDDAYFLTENTAVAFDSEHAWQEGDVLPYYLLQTPNGPRAAIRAQGRYADGHWRVTLSRTLASPNPLDSKALQSGGLYHVAFAVHHGGVGARFHHVSLPYSLGLGVDADIVATPAQSPGDDNQLTWHQIGLVNPHQVDWEWLVTRHQGANFIRGDMPVGVRDQHGHRAAFQRYLDRHEQRRKYSQPSN